MPRYTGYLTGYKGQSDYLDVKKLNKKLYGPKPKSSRKVNRKLKRGRKIWSY